MRGNQKSVVRALIEVNGTVVIPLSYIQSICIVESQLVIINVNFVLNSARPQKYYNNNRRPEQMKSRLSYV